MESPEQSSRAADDDPADDGGGTAAGAGSPRTSRRPGVVLEDLDAVEARRIERRRAKLPVDPADEGTPHDPRLYRRLIRYAVPYTGSLVLALLMSVLSAACKVGYFFLLEGILQPLFETGAPPSILAEAWRALGNIAAVDSEGVFGSLRLVFVGLFEVGRTLWSQSEPLAQLRWAAIALVFLVFLEQLNKYAQRLLMRSVSLDIVRTVRNVMFERLMTLSLRFFHKNHSGKLLSRLTGDLNLLGNLLVDVMVNIFSDLFTVIGALFYVWARGGSVVIVALVVAAVSFIPIQQLGRRIRTRELKNQKKMSHMFLALSETLQAQKIVKAFGAQRQETDRFRDTNDRFTHGRMRSAELRARTEPLVELLGVVGVALFLYFGGRGVLEGRWEGGSFFAIVMALFSCVSSLRRLSDTITKYQSGLSSADRVATLLYVQPEIVDAPGAVTLDGFREEIRFDGVHYSHDPENPTLEDVSFTLRRGETLALVGHTGSGKSTIGDLVPRFYDVDGGSVSVDGHDVREIAVQSLRDQIAMVTQETVLFQGTIASNIAYAMPDAAREDIERAARAAFAHDFIERLPDGYDTRVGERGMTLSGGERQRIAIARALLRDAPILILDEATSALDTRSERVVQEAIDNLKAGRTTIVIAHRLSTIRDADQILVLDQGRVAERGDHESLMALDGHYAAMVKLQSHG